MTIEHMESELCRMAELNDGVIDDALKMARLFPADMKQWPRVVPMPNGSLKFKWAAKGRTLEIKFQGHGSISYCGSSKRQTQVGKIPITKKGIHELIRCFVGDAA